MGSVEVLTATTSRTSAPPLSDVVFDEATPEQRKRTWEDNGIVWARPLSLENYIAREAALTETPLCRDGNCHYWILYRRDDPLDIISSCETPRKKMLVRRGRSGGRVDEVEAYSVGSVHTHPRYRARGMAGYLLGKVQEFLDERVQWSFLYSDIGRQYYAQRGWNVFKADQMTMSLVEPGFVVPQGIRLLQSGAEIKELCERDTSALRSRLAALPEDGRTHVAVVPTYEHISWQHTNASLSAKYATGRPVTNVGAVAAGGTSWILWFHDIRERELKIQRIVAEGETSVEDVRDLLEAAFAEAEAWGFKTVIVWAPGDTVSLGAKAVANGGRGYVKIVWSERGDTGLPSLRWRRDVHPGEVVWHDSEFYAWC